MSMEAGMGRKLTKEQLETLKPDILENVPVIIAVHDLDHNILWANKAYRDATGLSLKKIKGKKCYHAWGLDKLCKGCPVSKAMRTGKKQEAEMTPYNQKHWPLEQGSWLVKTAPIKDTQGKIIGAIEVAYDITKQEKSKNKLQKTTRELKERVKELNAIYVLSSIVEKPGVSVGEIFQGVADLIPPAWQYSEIACGRVVFKGQEYKTKNFKKTKWNLSADVKIRGVKKGVVEVCYLKNIPEMFGKPFQREEKNLINALAERLGRIIERKEAIKALSKAERKYEDLYNNAPDMFVSVDAKTSKIVECNHTFLKKTGYKKEKIIGKPIFSVYHPNSLEGAHKAFRSFVATGKVHDAELQLKKKDGSKIDVRLNVSAVRDKKNKVLYSRSVWRDISELKKVEKKISDLAKFPSENPEPVLRVSEDGEVLYSNAAGVKMILTTWESKVGGLAPERWRSIAKDALKTGGRVIEEGSFKDKVFLCTITPVSGEHYVNVYASDITELKKIEQVKYNIMRDVSHSIKTPLAVSRMANEILKNAINTKDIEKAKMAHDMLHKGIETALKDASNILTIYALSEGMVLGEDIMLSLKEIIRNILKDEEWILKQKGLEIKIGINKSADKFFCSHVEAEMLFKNIIENAIKFTEKGNISIKAVSKGKFIEVSITDTGKGITKRVQGKVFDRFFKQHKAVEGIGLGLSICREIVARKKGAIILESKGRGKGTTVTVSLPRKKL
jgi:PAS domain S-box-containing protein